MYCKNCGAMINDGIAFCHKCGTKVSKAKNVASNQNEVRSNAGKGFGIASIIAAFFLFISLQGSTEKMELIFWATLTLVLGIISLIESYRANKKRILPYISIIFSVLVLVLSSSILVQCDKCNKEGTWKSTSTRSDGSSRILCDDCANDWVEQINEMFK